MSITSIVRIGGPPESDTPIDILRQALLSHFPHPNDTSSLQMNNKYFTAHVQLQPVQPTTLTHKEEEEEPTNHVHPTKEDGLFLVIPTTFQSMDILTQWHESAERDQQAGDTLRLLIATHTHALPSTKEYEEMYSQRVLWCLDRGYEYVEVDVTPEGMQRGFEEREKDGFARVCEAMSGTVWGSAVMKSRGGEQTKNTSVGSGKNVNCENRVGHEEIQGSLHTTKEPVEQEEKEEEEDNLNILESKSNVSSPEPASPPKPAEEKEDQNDEDYLDNIEQIMKEAKQIRQASQAGEMTDEERRQRAGNAATMLMGLLDQMGFDDEDSSSDED